MKCESCGEETDTLYNAAVMNICEDCADHLPVSLDELEEVE